MNRDGPDLDTLARIDKLIHEPARLAIVSLLSAVDSADFVFLQRQTGLTRGNLSSHLSKLEEAGYIEVKKEFVRRIPRTVLRLTGEGRKAFGHYTTSLRRVLESLPDDKQAESAPPARTPRKKE